MDERSVRNLTGVHADLVRLAREAQHGVPHRFVIIEGLRDLRTQETYVQTGASQTMNSRHLTGHAFDFAVWDENNKYTEDFRYYAAVAKHIKATAKRMGIPITWGGDWRTRDGYHIQLTWKDYPLHAVPKKVRTSKTVISAAVALASSVATTVAQAPLETVEVIETAKAQLGVLDFSWVPLVLTALTAVASVLVIYERVKRLQETGE